MIIFKKSTKKYDVTDISDKEKYNKGDLRKLHLHNVIRLVNRLLITKAMNMPLYSRHWCYNGIQTDDIELMRTLIDNSIQIYNTERPHYSNYMRTPEQMHQQRKIVVRTYTSNFKLKKEHQHNLVLQ